MKERVKPYFHIKLWVIEGVSVGFAVKAWAVAISLVFVLCASLMIGALAVMTTAALFVAALIARGSWPRSQ